MTESSRRIGVIDGGIAGPWATIYGRKRGHRAEIAASRQFRAG